MKKYIAIITAFLTIGVTGCKKDFLNQEVNPNEPVTTSPQSILSGALNTSGEIVGDDYLEYGTWGGYVCNSNSYTPVPTLQEFAATVSNPPTPQDAWDDLFLNLYNYNNLQTSYSSVPADAYFVAIAMIMKAYDFEELVDNYNNVPYSQAFQPTTMRFPAYDTGQSIYNDLVKQLDAAITLITNSGNATNPGSSDIVYGGNMTDWQKFANTLKLRLAIHQSNLTTNTAQADLASTASIGYIDASSEANCQPGYEDALDKQNPFYGFWGFDQNGNPTEVYLLFEANSIAVGMLEARNDPRLTYFYAPVAGAPGNGILSDQLGNDITNPQVASALGPGLLKSSTQPEGLFSSHESCFLQAEAVARGWITDGGATPIELYNEGITASFNDLGVPTASLAPYLAQADVAYPTGASLQTQLKAIITQKYLALDGYFNLEAYNEFRRTGYPVLPQNPASQDPGALSPTLPTRIPYPLTELNTNPANLAKEGTINIFTSKIFWAQ